MVKRTAEDVNKMGHCGSGEAEVWAEVTLALEVKAAGSACSTELVVHTVQK